MASKEIIEIGSALLKAGKDLIKDDDVQKFLCGRYSDGTSRNVADAVHGEYLSPKQRKKLKKFKKKKKKNKLAKFRL